MMECGEGTSRQEHQKELEPVPLKKSKGNQNDCLVDKSQVSRSQSLTEGYEMDKDLSQTLSADVLTTPPPSNLEGVETDDANDTNKINEENIGSFVKAVHKKYADVGQLKHCFLGGLVVPKCSAVKMTESGNMLLPNQVSMSGCEISVAGNTDLIRRMCQNVTHLDLMANDIKHWEEVVSILECIPTLTFLNLSKNRIESALPDLNGRSLPSLTHLVLNDTNAQWEILLQLLQVCSQIEELHLSLNNFTAIDIPEDQSPCSSVRKLFFIGNQVTNWSQINKLGRFLPNLESLMLCETDISCLECHEDLAASFPSLEILSLNRSCLGSWEEIEKMDEFPRLSDVRLHNIPFFENFPTKVRRQRQIAMLPKITMLNKSPISEEEREDSERAYIRLYMDLDEEQQPSRYHELVRKHGSLQPLVKVDLRPKDTVRVKIIIDDDDDDGTITGMVDNNGDNNDPAANSTDDSRRGEIMDINVHTTAKGLRKMLSNSARWPASKLQLFHSTKGSNQGPMQMIYPDRKILAYRINDGDDIIVVKRP